MSNRPLFKPLAVLIPILFCINAPPAHTAEQYKKQNRDAISNIVDGDIEAAVQHFTEYLSQHPADLESMYGLTVAYTQKGQIEKAMQYVKQAVDNGLPFGRFLTGPRDLLQPLYDHPEFQEFAKDHSIEWLHGPLVGCVRPRSAKFWVRTVHEVPVQVIVSDNRSMLSPIVSEPVTTKSERDFTAIASVNGLQPNTEYFYEIAIDGNKQLQQWSFCTFPEDGSASKFQLGFGGGAGYTPQYEHMWNTIHSHSLRAFLFLGDNVYIDHPTQPAVQRYCYYRRQSRPEFRQFIASTSIFAIWDDHDFTTNDAGGGPARFEPEWKLPVWRVFKENWNNPSYGGGKSQPGCWFNFSIGDVDFIMLDGRYYRTEQRIEHPSMLGPAQKEWLYKTLKQAKGTFKVLASPVPWAYGAKPGSLDPWQGYKEERKEIFSFLADNQIDGVILISADRHRSDAWKIERENGYPLYEFESSRLTNIHTHGLMPGSMFGYNDTCSFGKLLFDTTQEDPTVSYEIYSIDNELIHKLTLKRSQISHK